MPAPIIIQAGEPRVLTVYQVFDLLNCSHKHTTRLIEAKKLVAVNLASDLKQRALYRIPLAGLQRFLQDAVVT